jgi:hypothetical protein
VIYKIFILVTLEQFIFSQTILTELFFRDCHSGSIRLLAFSMPCRGDAQQEARGPTGVANPWQEFDA